MIEIRMDGQPVGKGRPRFSRATGTVYTPEKTARYEERLAWAAQSIMAGRPLLTGALQVDIEAHMEIPKRKTKAFRANALADRIHPTTKPDPDNIAKMLDALNRVVWVDDSQIFLLSVHKRYSERPHIRITINEVCP